jgi:hypothetical protein
MASHGPPKTPRRSYFTTDNYGPFFFNYKTTLVNGSYRGTYNGTYVGSLTPVTTDYTVTPSGRILHETGKKLVPGANPGVSNYMVSVYDSVSLLKGYIDPNARVFQVYNESKPNFMPADANTIVNAFGGAYGPSLVTGGNILQITQDISGNLTSSFLGIQDNLSTASVYASMYQFTDDNIFYVECFDYKQSTCAYIGSDGLISATNGIGYISRTEDSQRTGDPVYTSVYSSSNAPTGIITLGGFATAIDPYSLTSFNYYNSTIGAFDYMCIQYKSGLPTPAFFSYTANCTAPSTAVISIMNNTAVSQSINNAVLQFFLLRYMSTVC